MTGAQSDRDAALGRLRQQTRQLVAELPGPLRRVRLSTGEATVEVEWPAAGTDAVVPGAADPNGNAAGPNGSAGGRRGSAAGPNGGTGADDGNASGTGDRADGPPPGSRDIVAPIVGTFYRAPEPGAEPYVQVGDLIEAGQVVGIVEAMKLMNQVTADTAGRVTAVLARDGEPVQFGQALIRLAIA